MSPTEKTPGSLLDRSILKQAALDSLRKLWPRHMLANPVMFVVEVGSVLTAALWLRDLVGRWCAGRRSR